MNLLRAATLTVSDAAAAAERYVEWLGYEIVETGTIAQDLAGSWGCHASAGRDYAVVKPASGRDVFIRLVAGDAVASYRSLRSFGWAALELCVTDVLTVQDRMRRSPFEIIGPAKMNPSLPTIFPMQVRGPEQEIIYLTEIRTDPSDHRLPRAQSLIDRIFILVMACSDMRASIRWFEASLDFKLGLDIEIDYQMLKQSFGTPPEQKYAICTMTNGSDVFLELDQYPPQATARLGHGGALPPGIAIGTFLHPELDRMRDWIEPPVAREGAIYAGARAGTLRAPDGTLVEIVETI